MHIKALFRLLLGLSAVFIFSDSLSMAKATKKMAVLPFVMNADRDLTFLQEGIVDMLSSRLAWKGELELLEKGFVREEMAKHKGPLNRESALAIGRSLNVDFVILGSLTVFGDSVSVDARILDVAKADELVTAFNQAKGMDAVIPTITRFAEDINEKVMGRPMAVPLQSAAGQDAPKGPGGLIGATQDFEGKGFSHTQAVRAEIISLDVGDVDGDGKNELVFIDSETVHVYKWAEKGFVPFKKVTERWATGFIFVSVADLDGNGRAEIYVSNVGESNTYSFILEWNGKEFQKIAGGIPWLIRAVEVTGKEKVLLGQRRDDKTGFSGDVLLMNREGGTVTPVEPLPLPKSADIFNFTVVDFEGKGSKDTVVLDSSEDLILYEPNGEQLWRSEDSFGGTYTFMKAEGAGVTKDHIFISSPVYVTDVDEDGKKEIMVCKNYSKIGRLLGKMRVFSSGAVNFMTRDEVGLSTKWSTKKLGGAIVGYRVADVDNDNLPELVIASVLREEGIISNSRSRIVVYDLK